MNFHFYDLILSFPLDLTTHHVRYKREFTDMNLCWRKPSLHSGLLYE